MAKSEHIAQARLYQDYADCEKYGDAFVHVRKRKPNIHGSIYPDKVDVAAQWVGLPLKDQQGRTVGVVTGCDNGVVTAKITDQQLIEEVLSGDTPELSMGCQVSRPSVCSICQASHDDNPNHPHLVPVPGYGRCDWPIIDSIGPFSNVVFSVVDAANLVDPACVITHTEEVK